MPVLEHDDSVRALESFFLELCCSLKDVVLLDYYDTLLNLSGSKKNDSSEPNPLRAAPIHIKPKLKTNGRNVKSSSQPGSTEVRKH